MSAVMGTPYSPPSPPATNSSVTMSPTMSPIYPDRPIRPLPKRSLKERLSSEAAEAISYPPVPQPSMHVPFQVPYLAALNERHESIMRGALREADKAMYQAHKQSVEDDKGAYRFRGNDLVSEDELELSLRSQQPVFQQRQSKILTNGYSHAQEKSHSIASSNDSADGYDSFENTNNKKKRKIPTSGNPPTLMSGSLSQDLANMGISNEADAVDRADNGISHYYTAGGAINSSGTGISGAARGRYGRNGRRDASGRLPLHSTVNGSNAWSNGKVALGGRTAASRAVLPPNGDKGIISQAIADAAALQNANQGQENVSLLEQQLQKKSPPGNSNFTFTCESESSNKPNWPRDSTSMGGSLTNHAMPPPLNVHTASASQHPVQKDFGSGGGYSTQTNPPEASQPGQDARSIPHGAAEAPRRPRRPAGRRYAMAARERRAQQEYNNYHHPPKEEEFWMCEFCEYESIFGKPPEALIRQYEMKDEKERKRQAEKRRLLEKAKMKGRKGKKGKGKGANNGGNNNIGTGNAGNAAAAAAAAPPTQSVYDPAMAGLYPGYDHAGEEEYYQEQYDEPGPTPVPSHEPASRIPGPVNHTPGQSTRMATPSHPQYGISKQLRQAI